MQRLNSLKFKPTATQRRKPSESEAESSNANNSSSSTNNNTNKRPFKPKPRNNYASKEATGLFASGIGGNDNSRVGSSASIGNRFTTSSVSTFVLNDDSVGSFPMVTRSNMQMDDVEITEFPKRIQQTNNIPRVSGSDDQLFMMDDSLFSFNLPQILPTLTESEGRIGELIIRKSGRIQLRVGDSNSDGIYFDLVPIKKASNEQVLLFNDSLGTVESLGNIKKSFCVIPIL